MLRKMKISPNAYYNYKKDKNAGYRMMRIYLSRAGITLSDTTVLKYMQELKIKSTITPKKQVYKKGECYKKFDNLFES